MALSKLAANSFDLTDNYAFTGTTTGATSTQKLFLIKNIDASSSSTVSFVDGASSVVLDNTYKTYYFKFINLHPSASNQMEFQGSTNGGTGYGVTITTTGFKAHHTENDSTTTLAYTPSQDVAQGTGYQEIFQQVGSDDAENSGSGELWLFNPSSTTFVKHFFSRSSERSPSDHYAISQFGAGYFNTTSAINAIQFRFASGNIDSGRIALYGIK